MPEPGIRFLALVGQCHPGLDAIHRAAVSAEFFETLGVGDAATGGHPVALPRPDRLVGAEAVSMHDVAVETVGYGHSDGLRIRTQLPLPGPAPADRPRSP